LNKITLDITPAPGHIGTAARIEDLRKIHTKFLHNFRMKENKLNI